jgi:cellulose 1,4-beta-cellobiosidase
MASAFTVHPCAHSGPLRCEGQECGDNDKGERQLGTCDKDGCDFNSYRNGDASFFGPGKTIDTTKPFTLIT